MGVSEGGKHVQQTPSYWKFPQHQNPKLSYRRLNHQPQLHPLPQVRHWESQRKPYETAQKVHGWTSADSLVQRTPRSNLLLLPEESVKIRMQVTPSAWNFAKAIKNRWAAHCRPVDRDVLHLRLHILVNRANRHPDEKKPASGKKQLHPNRVKGGLELICVNSCLWMHPTKEKTFGC